MPVMNETPYFSSVHYTEYYCTCTQDECQALFSRHQRTLTKIFLRGRIEQFKHAGVVELADTYDLGSYVVRHAGSSPVARTK